MSDKDDLTTDVGSADTSMATAAEVVDELGLLKQRADLMGIKYHPNTGVAKLRALIEEKKAAPVADPNAAEEAETIQAYQDIENVPTLTPLVQETAAQLAMKRRKEALRLVRVRVTNMNPLKGAMLGEIFSVGNSQVGFVKKYVPYNAEAGWHVPQIILQQMQAKKYMSHYIVKENGKPVNKHRLVPELAIEILPPLTAQELQDLKQRQLMANAGQS
jgi:hypothetical protein